MRHDDRETSAHRAPLASWGETFVAFARVGLTSFGGGSATVSAMRQLCLRRGWMTESEFVHALVLSRLTPGISILSQVILIGRRLCGVRGMVAGLAGLMLPSLAITIALSYAYQRISGYTAAQEPLHLVAAVAAGFSVALAIQLLRDIMKPVPPLRAAPLFLLFLAIGLWLRRPLPVMAIAIGAALLFPRLFDLERPSDARADDEA